MNYKQLKDVKYIAIHCSATPPSMDIGAVEIDRWHRDEGWLMIGYHYVVRRDGTIERGRPPNAMGAHVYGYNEVSLGVCWVGGVSKVEKLTKKHRAQALDECEEDNRTPEQIASLAKLVKMLQEHHPDAVVQGHRDFPHVTKRCPSFDVRPWWAVTGPATPVPESVVVKDVLHS